MDINMKKIILVICTLLISISAGCANSSSDKNKLTEIKVTMSSSAINTDSITEMVGFADYVFVGEVLREKDTVYKVSVPDGNGDEKTVKDPYTNYSVKVIENIKGTLEQTNPIIVQKAGGISEDGEYYELREGDLLPQVGNTYIFLVCAQPDGINLSSGANSTISIDERTPTSISTFSIQPVDEAE